VIERLAQREPSAVERFAHPYPRCGVLAGRPGVGALDRGGTELMGVSIGQVIKRVREGARPAGPIGQTRASPHGALGES
jgi:hypothetical protein